MDPASAFRARLLERQGSLTRSRHRYRGIPSLLGIGIRAARIGRGLGALVALLVFVEQAKAQSLTLSSTDLVVNEGETISYTVALTLTIGRPEAEGLSLTVSPQWSDATSGAGSLRHNSLDRDFQNTGRNSWMRTPTTELPTPDKDDSTFSGHTSFHLANPA